MEHYQQLILLFYVGFFGAITPGPDILLTFKTTLRFGIAQGLKVLLGIVSGWCVYFGIIFSIVYIDFTHWFNVLPVINIALNIILCVLGGSYLSYLSFYMLTSHPKTYEKDYAKNIVDSADSIQNPIRKDGYIQGLLLNLSNPKAMLFFVFLITPFLENQVAISLIVLWSSLLCAFLCVIFGAHKIRKYINARAFLLIDRICGVLFVGFAWFLYFGCGQDILFFIATI